MNEKRGFDSRPSTAYGAYDTYEKAPPSRAISPAASYQDMRARSIYDQERARSTYEPPQLPYTGSLIGGSPAASFAQLPDSRSFYGGSVYVGDARSVHESFYGQPQPQPGSRVSSYSYSQPTRPVTEHRTSSYSIQPQRPGGLGEFHPLGSTYSLASVHASPPFYGGGCTRESTRNRVPSRHSARSGSDQPGRSGHFRQSTRE